MRARGCAGGIEISNGAFDVVVTSRLGEWVRESVAGCGAKGDRRIGAAKALVRAYLVAVTDRICAIE